MHPYNELEVFCKLSVNKADEKLHGTFGRGTVSLLQGVKELGSLNQAAKRLNMAYSKAWRLVKEAEAHVGVNLIERKGPHGSDLSPEGQRLLEVYQQVELEAQALVNIRFRELLTADKNDTQ